MGKIDVFGIDGPCVDLNVNIDRLPNLNDGTRVNDLSWQGGGKVASGIVTSARLGVSCAIAGFAGDDLFGKFCYDDFQRHGVDVSNMKLREGETTSLSVVLSERASQSRTILYRVGTAHSLTEDEVNWEDLRRAQYLFVAQTDGISRKAIELARAYGKTVFIDADYYTDSLEQSVELIDDFIGSEFVFNAMFPESRNKPLELLEGECRSILKRGPEICVFTFGARGCVGCSKKEGFFTMPAFQVNVVDTVGAGDVFHGAFLAALIHGMSPRECARYASAVSAIKCTQLGGRAGIPTWEVLEHFLATGEIDDTELSKRAEYYKRGIEYVSV